jgi:hypothetical protein
MEWGSSVYTYKEWSGRTCLNQEWCLYIRGVERENMSQPGMEQRSGVYKGTLCVTQGYRVQNVELKRGKIIEAEGGEALTPKFWMGGVSSRPSSLVPHA